MKICMLSSSYPKYPGETTAPFIEEIAAGLVRRGHEVHVVAPFHRDVRRGPIERGVHLHFFRYAPLPALNIWGYAESLHADISVRGRTLLAAPLAVGASVAALLRLTKTLDASGSRFAVRGSTVPDSAVRGSRFDLIHAHWVLPNAVPAAVAAKLRRLPLVVSLHGSDVFLAEQAPPLSLAAAGALRAAAGITACSGDLRERALRLGARPTCFEVVPYGVDASAFRPDPQAGARVRAELGLAPTAPLIVSVSRLVYKKGLTFLLDAFPAILRRHPHAVLVIAGYGDLREPLERQATALGIAASVRFPGQLDRAGAARYIAAANVYVVPSVRDQGGNVDGLPNALLEGLGSGRPVVASRVAGIPEVIDHERQGLLVAERDSVGLAVAIVRLLDHPDFAAELGRSARVRVVHELTWDKTAERFERVYLRATQRIG
ncbi:MAG: glycosyltransferase [Roseiflexaceae bacterium]|nr:glycosyltransferase [Roseiflexaceae bacterium]